MHAVHEYLKMDKDSIPAGKILVTAGPTIEPLDPVRYISNYSTGRMGYEIAAECAKRGFEVCLISGPVNLCPPEGVETVGVITAREMRDRVIERVSECDCLIMAAAVCDFRPEKEEKHKIKKKKTLSVRFARNTDILLEIGKREGLVKVGFALESENPVENGKNKLKEKSLDIIVVNKKDTETNPFGPGKKEYILIDAGGIIKRFEGITKRQMAGVITGEVEALL